MNYGGAIARSRCGITLFHSDINQCLDADSYTSWANRMPESKLHRAIARTSTPVSRGVGNRIAQILDRQNEGRLPVIYEMSIFGCKGCDWNVEERLADEGLRLWR